MHEVRQTKQTRLLLGDFIVEVVVGRNTVKRGWQVIISITKKQKGTDEEREG